MGDMENTRTGKIQKTVTSRALYFALIAVHLVLVGIFVYAIVLIALRYVRGDVSDVLLSSRFLNRCTMPPLPEWRNR